MVFYLKYRPQTLDELVGQEVTKKTLLSAFTNNKLAHAYLFVGPRGTGKTSTARILAKMVNCSAEQNIPCNKCDNCRTIADGSNLDLIEIDAASNRGIDDIRSLREKIKLSPTSAKKKVYIIDEVHMLTTEAFNALLKTLEEPPEHALFILATTDAQKVPQTILSRVQRLDFKLASVEELMEALKVVVEKEKIEIEEEALRLVAKLADGSFRDGEKLLDQLSSASEAKITTDMVSSGLKSTSFEVVVGLIADLSGKDTKNALIKVNEQLVSGANIRNLVTAMMDCMRSILLIKNDLGKELVESVVSKDQYQKLEELAGQFNSPDLCRALELLQSALEQMKYTSILSLPLELAIVEMGFSPSVVLSETQQSEEPLSDPMPVGPASSLDTAATRWEPSSLSPTLEDNERKDSPDVSKLQEKWTFVLEAIRPYNFSLEALLRSVKILDCDGEVVKIEVPYAFHQRILEAPKSRDLLESVLSDVLGKKIRVVGVVGTRPVRVEDIANVEVAAEDEVLRLASEIFNGKLVD